MTRLATMATGEVEKVVSAAIVRAELLESQGLPSAADAWREVLAAELELASRAPADDLMGGIARVGAVAAALAAGAYRQALSLAESYRSDPVLPAERRSALDGVFADFEERQSRRFPALARRGSLRAVLEWKASVEGRRDLVFPWAA